MRYSSFSNKINFLCSQPLTFIEIKFLMELPEPAQLFKDASAASREFFSATLSIGACRVSTRTQISTEEPSSAHSLYHNCARCFIHYYCWAKWGLVECWNLSQNIVNLLFHSPEGFALNRSLRSRRNISSLTQLVPFDNNVMLIMR